MKYFSLVRELKEELIALIVDQVLRIVKEDGTILAVEFAGEFREPLRIAREELFNDN